jgi:hypothetical protein
VLSGTGLCFGPNAWRSLTEGDNEEDLAKWGLLRNAVREMLTVRCHNGNCKTFVNRNIRFQLKMQFYYFSTRYFFFNKSTLNTYFAVTIL